MPCPAHAELCPLLVCSSCHRFMPGVRCCFSQCRSGHLFTTPRLGNTMVDESFPPLLPSLACLSLSLPLPYTLVETNLIFLSTSNPVGLLRLSMRRATACPQLTRDQVCAMEVSRLPLHSFRPSAWLSPAPRPAGGCVIPTTPGHKNIASRQVARQMPCTLRMSILAWWRSHSHRCSCTQRTLPICLP